MIISISGYKGHGKDLVANIIQEMDPSYTIKKQALPVKQICSLITGIPLEKFEDEEFKNNSLGKEWNKWYIWTRKGWDSLSNEQYNKISAINRAGTFLEQSITIRQLMQQVGTDLFRNNLHENTWVNCLMSQYTSDYKWIISDTRFPNEVNAVVDNNGLCIKVVLLDDDNNPIQNLDAHESETALDNYNWHYIIQAKKGDITEIRNQIIKCLTKYNLIN